MLKIRRPLGRLIFNMGIAIPCKTIFLIETAPWVLIWTNDSLLLVGPFLWNLNVNTTIFIQEMGFKYEICKMLAILSQPQCENTTIHTVNLQTHNIWIFFFIFYFSFVKMGCIIKVPLCYMFVFLRYDIHCIFNSMWPSHAIWCHWYWSPLVQVIAC